MSTFCSLQFDVDFDIKRSNAKCTTYMDLSPPVVILRKRRFLLTPSGSLPVPCLKRGFCRFVFFSSCSEEEALCQVPETTKKLNSSRGTTTKETSRGRRVLFIAYINILRGPRRLSCLIPNDGEKRDPVL
jgi:hypothetical protein